MNYGSSAIRAATGDENEPEKAKNENGQKPKASAVAGG